LKVDGSSIDRSDSPRWPSADDFRRAAASLEQGGIVAFPTETFYGLAVDPFNEQAVNNLYRLKGRPLHKPFLVLIQDASQLPMLARSIPPPYERLMRDFWPGPLTLVFPAVSGLSTVLTGAGPGIGARISPHPVALAFGKMWGKPMTATSANRSGMEAACTASEVRQIFGEEIACTLDGGRTQGGMSSTVVGLEQGELRLIRAGVIDFSTLVQVGTGRDEVSSCRSKMLIGNKT
jgi:L-threonylcarbamoyladenylate synthase